MSKLTCDRCDTSLTEGTRVTDPFGFDYCKPCATWIDDNPDIRLRNEGNLILFEALSGAGRNWLEENTDGTWFGPALVVEHRYAAPLAEGAIEAGLEVK